MAHRVIGIGVRLAASGFGGGGGRQLQSLGPGRESGPRAGVAAHCGVAVEASNTIVGLTAVARVDATSWLLVRS